MSLKKLEARALRFISWAPPAFQKHVARYDETGEDLAVAVREEYVQWQRQWWDSRKQRLRDEIVSLVSGRFSLAGITMLNVFWVGRTLIASLAIFLVFALIGRGSIFPRLAPTSKLLQTATKENINLDQTLALKLERL